MVEAGDSRGTDSSGVTPELDHTVISETTQSAEIVTDAPKYWSIDRTRDEAATVLTGGTRGLYNDSSAKSTRIGYWSLVGVNVLLAVTVTALITFLITTPRQVVHTRTKAPTTVENVNVGSAASIHGTRLCVGGDSDAGMSPINDINVLSTGSPLSCGFASTVTADIEKYLSNHPQAETFPVKNEFSPVTGHRYNFNCNRVKNVTKCAARGDSGELGIALVDLL